MILGIATPAVGGVVTTTERSSRQSIFAGRTWRARGIGTGGESAAGNLRGCRAQKREKKALGLGPQAGKASIGMGLLYCLFSGLGSALVGIGLDNGKSLVDAKRRTTRKSNLGSDGCVAAAGHLRWRREFEFIFTVCIYCVKIKREANFHFRLPAGTGCSHSSWRFSGSEAR